MYFSTKQIKWFCMPNTLAHFCTDQMCVTYEVSGVKCTAWRGTRNDCHWSQVTLTYLIFDAHRLEMEKINLCGPELF